jgi:hypothetical protein
VSGFLKPPRSSDPKASAGHVQAGTVRLGEVQAEDEGFPVSGNGFVEAVVPFINQDEG